MSKEMFAAEDTTTMVISTREHLAQAHDILDSAKLPVRFVLTPQRASDELTSRMHCAIRCIAKQVEWAGEKLTEEEWKLLFVAAHFGQRVVPSPDGSRFIVLQKQTRNMSGAQKHELTEMIYAFGASRDVIFDDPETE